MKTKTLFIVGAVTLTVASISAQAQVPINGEIQFTGAATVDTAIPNATTFETFFGPSGSGGPVVLAGGGLPVGSYAGVAGNTVANVSGSFDFPTYYAAWGAFDLYSFTSGGQTYSFQINTVANDQQFAGPITFPFDFIIIGGMGTATITGGPTTYLPTPEWWSITGTNAPGSLTITGLTITIGEWNVAVPEPSTLAFGGLGSLLSIATLIRRK